VTGLHLSRLYRMLVSALIAGMLTGLISYNGGASLKAALLGASISALKDVQAYLSSAPGSPH
jgi:hypothetical protein